MLHTSLVNLNSFAVLVLQNLAGALCVVLYVLASVREFVPNFKKVYLNIFWYAGVFVSLPLFSFIVSIAACGRTFWLLNLIFSHLFLGILFNIREFCISIFFSCWIGLMVHANNIFTLGVGFFERYIVLICSYLLTITCCMFFFVRERRYRSSKSQTLDKKYDESLENASDTQVYLSYVSHELRAPLQGIKGVADFLTRSRLPSDDYKHQVNILSTSCTQLLITASNVLDFEKFRSGYKVLNLGYVNIQEVVESVVKELQATSMLHNTVVKVYCPKIFVELDSVKISHVLRNLVSNALKFTKNGQVMVRVFESGENLHFSVADNGPGVAQNDRDGLFDNFQQGCNAKQDSSGLGLSVAKRCIELHNGKIWFEPNLPSGAVFSFTIPLKKEVEDDYDQECRGRIDSANVFWNNVDSGTVSKAQAWLRKQVLVALLVDDDEISVVSTGFMLEKLGFKVLYAMSFYSAIEVLSRDKIDIVLLDIMLGGQEFYECLNGVAKYAPEASIILQTGVSKGAVVTLADKYTQIVGYLMKPYGAEDMKGILRTLSHPPHSK